MTDKDKLYSGQEVAAMLGRQPVTIRSLARRKGIGQKVGNAWVYTEADIAAIAAIDPRGGRPVDDEPIQYKAGLERIKDRGPKKKTPPAESE